MLKAVLEMGCITVILNSGAQTSATAATDSSRGDGVCTWTKDGQQMLTNGDA